jgi:hypothetical protein
MNQKKITRRLVKLAIEMQRPGYLAERMEMYRKQVSKEQRKQKGAQAPQP